MKIILVAAARPNFMKVAPLIRAIDKSNAGAGAKIEYMLVHTGQHYDYGMSQVFFEDLGLPAPDIHLGVGSGTHAEQTGRVMIEFENVLLKEKPDLVVVVGGRAAYTGCARGGWRAHRRPGHARGGQPPAHRPRFRLPIHHVQIRRCQFEEGGHTA